MLSTFRQAGVISNVDCQVGSERMIDQLPLLKLSNKKPDMSRSLGVLLQGCFDLEYGQLRCMPSYGQTYRSKLQGATITV